MFVLLMFTETLLEEKQSILLATRLAFLAIRRDRRNSCRQCQTCNLQPATRIIKENVILVTFAGELVFLVRENKRECRISRYETIQFSRKLNDN